MDSNNKTLQNAAGGVVFLLFCVGALKLAAEIVKGCFIVLWYIIGFVGLCIWKFLDFFYNKESGVFRKKAE